MVRAIGPRAALAAKTPAPESSSQSIVTPVDTVGDAPPALSNGDPTAAPTQPAGIVSEPSETLRTVEPPASSTQERALAPDANNFQEAQSRPALPIGSRAILPPDVPFGNQLLTQLRALEAVTRSSPSSPEPGTLPHPEKPRSEAVDRNDAPVGSTVETVAQRSFIAPFLPPAAPTAMALSLVMASDPTWRAAAAIAGEQPAAPGAAQTLTIQLKPVELGTVTASLRLVGERLQVEIEVENAEAHRRLTAEKDSIVQSLKNLGFDIEQVTIQQPQVAANAAPRADVGMAAAGRDGQSFAPGSSEGQGGQASGREAGGDDRRNASSDRRQAPPARDRGGDGVYI